MHGIVWGDCNCALGIPSGDCGTPRRPRRVEKTAGAISAGTLRREQIDASNEVTFKVATSQVVDRHHPDEPATLCRPQALDALKGC